MEALPVPRVSMRELTRRTSEILKRVQLESRPVVVTSHGAPIALLSPIAAANGIVGLLDRPTADEKELIQDALEALDENERRVLEIFPPGPRNGLVPDRICIETSLEWSQVRAALMKLETAGLIRKRPGGYVRL